MLREAGQRRTQDDTWGVGKLILMCLEPGTFLKNCEDLEEDWNSDLIAFHKLTKIKPVSELLQVFSSFPSGSRNDIYKANKHPSTTF